MKRCFVWAAVPFLWIAAFASAEEAHLTVPAGDPVAEGISPAALEQLVERARESDSDALVVLKNGKLIGE